MTTQERSQARRKFFTPAEILAIRDGSKTQFSVPSTVDDISFTEHDDELKGQRFLSWSVRFSKPTGPMRSIGSHSGTFISREQALSLIASEYGPYRPGQMLWVPEAWAWAGKDALSALPLQYKADRNDWLSTSRWRLAATMPREHARTFIKITGASIERLNSISEEDARAEGFYSSGFIPTYNDPDNSTGGQEYASASDNFIIAWENKHGPGSFDDRWVWRYTIEVQS
jgi:hypothetical protein